MQSPQVPRRAPPRRWTRDRARSRDSSPCPIASRSGLGHTWPRAAAPPSSDAAILELADARDRDAHRVAGLQESRRVEADADAGGRAGRNDVPGQEGRAGRDRGDQGRNVEDEVARVGALAQLAVDPAFHLEVLWIERVGGRDPRAHGAERVEGLAEEPLLV